ncbi:MAG: hypothetical protein K2J04_06175 [Lachnospiraceae bacterium]|nr:hypothetical protein [Lachnospiraceae bacterium]
MLNKHSKEKFHYRKKRRILGIIISICLLLQGCSADNENTDTFPQESQQEEAVTEPALEESESGKGAEQTVEDNGSSYMKAYWQFLESYVEESEYAQWARVTLAFIDDDNVPELLLIEDNSHPTGVKVYTYYQESVIELGEFGSFGSMQYVEKGGMIFSGWSGMGEGVSDFYRVEDGEAKLLCSIRDYEPFDGSPETYEIDGVSATEEENNEKWEELYYAYEYTLIGYDDALAIEQPEVLEGYDKWHETEYKMIQYDDCRTLTGGDIQSALTEELENLILTQ